MRMTVQPIPEDGEDREFTLIPDDTMHPAELVKISEKEWPDRDDPSKKNKRLEFEFKITDGEFKNRRVWGSTPANLVGGDRCKLLQWAQELMGGVTLAVGDSLDTDDLIGARCRIIIGSYESGNPKVKRNTVAQIRRAKDLPAVSYDEPY